MQLKSMLNFDFVGLECIAYGVLQLSRLVVKFCYFFKVLGFYGGVVA